MPRRCRFHPFLLWVVLLVAVPFQGYAAVSMAFCDTGHSATTSTSPIAAHAQPAPGQAAALHADAHDAAGLQHKCGTCGACHAVALRSEPTAVPTPPLPRADLAEPPPLAVSFAPLLPDRPPQA